MDKKIIHTNQAPKAIGTYSQAVSISDAKQTIYLSGQIPLEPETMRLVSADIEAQIHQVFKNLAAVCDQSGGSLAQIVKLTVYLSDLTHFPLVNEIMATYFKPPYPARAAVGVKQLPKDALIEADAIMCL